MIEPVEPKLDHERVVQSIGPGVTIPEDFPSEGLFLLRLGLYLNESTLSELNRGNVQHTRAAKIRILVEKLEEIAQAIDEIGDVILESDDPSPTDYQADEYEMRVDAWWNGIQAELGEKFVRLAEIVGSIERAVEPASRS